MTITIDVKEAHWACDHEISQQCRQSSDPRCLHWEETRRLHTKG